MPADTGQLTLTRAIVPHLTIDAHRPADYPPLFPIPGALFNSFPGIWPHFIAWLNVS